jgi:PIN domain nuclease of toxin-antitoxin system
MIVLDASALLAFVQREPGGLKVKAELHNCAISAVNFTEVLNRLQKTLGPQDVAVAGAHLPTLLREIVAYTGDDAHATSSVYAVTRNLGLSLGDCVCLALGKKLNAPVWTCDRSWASLDANYRVSVIR